jgi:hypothetical protein
MSGESDCCLSLEKHSKMNQKEPGSSSEREMSPEQLAKHYGESCLADITSSESVSEVKNVSVVAAYL